MLGLGDGFMPKFLKEYATLRELALEACQQYVKEVQAGQFPGPEHVHH
jgi:3-methyl-2-oxobutanoate hydroxymethyltransferase